jgi:LysM repeat protein
MRIWTFIKLLAALVVLGVIAFTGLLTYHIAVRPLGDAFGGVFEKLIPNPAEVVSRSEKDLSSMLEAPEMPDVEPGEVAYQKALELVALGKLGDAREKLLTIVNIYPSSRSAKDAKRIVGEMNLDELLSPTNKDGKSTYDVQKGDSFLKIAEKTRCSLDFIMMLNGLTDFGGLHPGDDLLVMPLDFRILIDLPKNSVSLWQAGKFVKDYPIAHAQVAANMAHQSTRIDSKAGYAEGKKYVPGNKGYRQADKFIHLAKINLQIRPFTPAIKKEEIPPRGIYLQPHDMEELNLLTRTGNEVEIRTAAR